jgi:hypothetical protein
VALEERRQPTILLGTTTFTAKARTELQTWGLSPSRYLEVPHNYQRLADESFAAVLADVVQRIGRLVGEAV